MRLEWVLAAAIAGALLGDGSAFWIGHRSQREILSAWPMTNYPRVIAQSEAFFHRWGSVGGVFRALRAADQSLRADHGGRAGYGAAAFLRRQHPGDPVWAPAHVLPGVLAVSALHEYAGISHHTGLGKHYWVLTVAGVALILALANWTIRRRHGGGVIEPAVVPVRKDS